MENSFPPKNVASDSVGYLTVNTGGRYNKTIFLVEIKELARLLHLIK